MPKPRMCPHCKRKIPISHGFDFDKNMNLICGKCKKVVVSVVVEKESPTTNTNTNAIAVAADNYHWDRCLPGMAPYCKGVPAAHGQGHGPHGMPVGKGGIGMS